ncbi:ribulose-phosphate 3-epimerase [Mycoplasmopsis arginini]|uniref:ribulose-phosphate 3-epimerase n=1 Tax=Mycoplasmopsis arginini TaxID=2094 RepID=UPI000D60B3B2|nr:ribulose-phosphate 3-epimerase [Mycoplasmopsis arginini]PWC08774.1 ribulose-phosphate 3-epimerase [Mycoplasmopsis arginini]
MKKISPSILDVSKDELINYVNKLIEWNINNVHYDVMDQEFVPNQALSYKEIEQIYNKCPKHQMDIHLMVKDINYYYDLFKKFDAILTFHYEAFKNENQIQKLIKQAKKDNVKIGIAFNPDTEVDKILPLLKNFDLVLPMSVYPGKGGQSFIENTYTKVELLKDYINKNNLNIIIEIDGGVKDFNIKKCFDSGVDLAVVGSFLVKNFSKETIDKLLE